MRPEDIIIKPVLTEKGYDGIPQKCYTFIVDRSANKIEIRQAVEALFPVQVESVHTMNYKGKPKTQGRTSGYTSRYKKAIVQLKPESKAIDFFASLT